MNTIKLKNKELDIISIFLQGDVNIELADPLTGNNFKVKGLINESINQCEIFKIRKILLEIKNKLNLFLKERDDLLKPYVVGTKFELMPKKEDQTNEEYENYIKQLDVDFSKSESGIAFNKSMLELLEKEVEIKCYFFDNSLFNFTSETFYDIIIEKFVKL